MGRNPTRRTVVLLGPQRLAPTARDAVRPLASADDPVAIVTAGWEERELEHDELGAHLAREVVNLRLHARLEEVLAQDAELHEGLRERHRQLLGLQKLYRVRLRHMAKAAAALLKRDDPAELIEEERDDAFKSLHALDEHHLERITLLQRTFESDFDLDARPSLQPHREAIEAQLAESGALCIAGGHVRVLLTRLWLFDVLGALPAKTPVVAWSAGAMALTEEVVLFHDSPPQGRGWAEVLGPGLGICPGLVALPNASRRLQLEDPIRVQMLARRFPESICAALDQRTKLTYEGGVWTAGEPTLRLTAAGGLAALSALGSR